MRLLIRNFLMLLAAAVTITACAPSGPTGPLIFAASSLQQPLETLAEQWTAAGHEPPQLSFGSSAALARQIENGSGGDIFISADQQWTDYISKAGKIPPDRIYPVAANRLVIAVAAGTTPPSLGELPAFDRIVTGDPASVPLGRYAREALVTAGIWEAVEPKLAGAQSARGALMIIARGEADAAIIYASDALNVKQIASAPIAASTHSPIVYSALKLPASAHPDTEDFLAFVASPAAVKVFDAYGFTRP